MLEKEQKKYPNRVAPLVGAWIEIDAKECVAEVKKSLPSWERGLKLQGHGIKRDRDNVAPLVGAWIEIFANKTHYSLTESLPSWERGLKS